MQLREGMKRTIKGVYIIKEKIIEKKKKSNQLTRKLKYVRIRLFGALFSLLGLFSDLSNDFIDGRDKPHG